MGAVFFLFFMIFVLIVGLTIFTIGLVGCILIKINKRKKSKPVKKVFKILSVISILLGLIITLIPVSFGGVIVYNYYSTKQYEKTIEYATHILDYDGVLALLEEGADPDESQNSFTPLMHVCTMNDDSSERYEIAKLLIQYGADVNAQYDGDDDGSEKGYSALFYAVTYEENPNMVKLLIDNKADVNHRAADGKTPLTIARERAIYRKGGNDEIIQILIDNGASE